MAGNGRKTSRVSHSSLERTACDKCRCQKLRCIRDKSANNNSLSTCRRCVNAGVICITSPAKPLGRHSIRQTHIGTNTQLETSTQTKSGKGSHQKGSEDIQVPHNKPLGLEPPGPVNISRLNPPLPIDKHQGGTFVESGGAGTIDSNIPHQAEGDAAKSNIDTVEIQCCRLNLSLSQLVMVLRTGTGSDRDLRTRIIDINSAPLNSDENSQTAQTNLIGLVLDRTSEFLSILQECSQEFLNHGSPNTEPGNGLHQTPQEKNEVYGPSKHAEVWIFHTFMPPASQESSESTANSTFTKKQITQPLSTSTILNLAGCYLHFITIYNILLQKMRVILQEPSRPSIENLQIVRGLKLTEFRVNDIGLQVKILVQVMEHQLELIEKALGLPYQYRLRPKSYQRPKVADGQYSLEGKGVFDGPEAGTFLESAMRLNDKAATQSISSLRHNLNDVLELIKASQ